MIALWMEGFAANGDRGTAQLLGHFPANSLAEAVDRWMETRPPLATYLNAARTTVWGCRLFDNEADARRNFG